MQVARGERAGEQARGGPRVDHDRIARFDQRRGSGGDTRPLLSVYATAKPETGLIDQREAGAAPVGPLQCSALGQLVEIAPRRFGGHAERLRERRNPNDAVAAQQREDLRMTFVLIEAGLWLAFRHERGERDRGALMIAGRFMRHASGS